MSLKTKVFEFMQNKDSVSLKEIYLQNFGKPESVRGIINLSIKQNEGKIIRISRGKYKIAIEVNKNE